MELIRRRRGLIGQRESDARLPRGYREVEYIQSTGTQRIDTGVDTSLSPYFRLQFKMMPMVLGGYFYGTGKSWLSFEYLPSSHAAYWNTGTSTKRMTHNMVAEVDVEYDVKYQNGVQIVTGSYVGQANYAGSLPGDNFAFFCNGHTNYSRNRLYYLKLYQGENFDLVADFVPCYRISDGKIGMYDLVSQSFFSNAGTGEFLKGADV